MKRIGSASEQRIGLYCLQNDPILPGEEITYNYGSSTKNMPWRNKSRYSNLVRMEKKIEYPAIENSWKFCIFCKDNEIDPFNSTSANKRYIEVRFFIQGET